MSDRSILIFGLLALAGFADATYLSAIHFYQSDPGCSVITGCDAVLSSEYATLLGIPLAYLGVVYYLVLLTGSLMYYQYSSRLILSILKTINGSGLAFSIYLIYLQSSVLNAFCQYCLLSAAITTLMFIIIMVSSRQTESY